jgi:hypothetical protein
MRAFPAAIAKRRPSLNRPTSICMSVPFTSALTARSMFKGMFIARARRLPVPPGSAPRANRHAISRAVPPSVWRVRA